MVRTLLVVRHAKSDWSVRASDEDRPLAPRGRRQAPESGAWIAAHLALDLAVVSPATRARQTWELMAACLDSPPPVTIEEAIYESWDLLDVVRRLPASARAVALVGHNPSVEDLVESLTGEGVRMPTSALAVIELDCAWSEAAPGAGRLVASGRPPLGGDFRSPGD